MTVPAQRHAGERTDVMTADQQKSPLINRLSFHLTYGYAPQRSLETDCITGPNIPNAYDPSGPLSSGEWDLGQTALPSSAEQAFTVFFTAAINEAVHEALEWFRLDGRPVLDPHGEHEIAIHDLSQRLGEQLLALSRSTEVDYPTAQEEARP